MTAEGREGIRNIGLTGLGQIARFCLLLATVVLLPRLFGPEDYGRFSMLLAVVSMLFVLSVLGLRFAELRFLSPLIRGGQLEAAQPLASSILNLRLISGLLAALICVFWIGYSDSTEVGLLFAVGIFALSRYWLEASRSLLLPLGRIRWYISLDLLYLLATLVSMILGYRLAGLVGALGLTSAGALLLFFLSYRLNVRVIQLQLLRIDWKKIEEILPYCLFSLLSAFFLAAQASMPVWLLSLADELSQVAYLGISVQVLLSLRGVYAAVWQALLPILSTLEERDEKARLAQWISLLMRVTTVLFTVVALFWLFTGQQLTLWVFGSGYGAVYPCLLFVLVASTLFSTGACVNGLLQVKKRTGLSALNHFVFLCSTLFGIYLLNDDWRGIDALGICRVFIWSSGLFFVSSYVTLGLFEKSWIPVVRGSVLLIPVLLIPALWDATGEIVLRFDMAILYLLLYLVIVVVAQLVRFSELRYAWSMLRG